MSDESIIFKILLVGPKDVGKTTFIQKSADVVGENTSLTIGVNFSLKNFTHRINGENHFFSFQLWEMNESDKFKSSRSIFIPGLQGLILCFNTGSRNEFKVLERWIQDVNQYEPNNVPKVLIRTKTDLIDRSKPDKNRRNIVRFMNTFAIDDYIEISSVTGENIFEIYRVFANLCYQNFLSKYNLINTI